MVRLNWTRSAVEDLKSIADYIAKDSVRYAKIQVFRLKSRTKVLKANPHIGRPVPEFVNERYRESVEGNYKIIYEIVDKERIDILAIHHVVRDLAEKQVE